MNHFKVSYQQFGVLGGLSLLLPQGLWAQAAPAGAGGSALMNSLGIVLMFAVFFFLIILPQSRKAKKHAQFLAELKKGDAVVTQGGIYGRIHGLAEKVVTLEIAPKTHIRVDRQSIVGKDPFATASQASEESGAA